MDGLWQGDFNYLEVYACRKRGQWLSMEYFSTLDIILMQTPREEREPKTNGPWDLRSFFSGIGLGAEVHLG